MSQPLLTVSHVALLLTLSVCCGCGDHDNIIFRLTLSQDLCYSDANYHMLLTLYCVLYHYKYLELAT